MIRVRKIAHATYETPDLARQTEYYTDILGLTVTAMAQDHRVMIQGAGEIDGVPVFALWVLQHDCVGHVRLRVALASGLDPQRRNLAFEGIEVIVGADLEAEAHALGGRALSARSVVAIDRQ